MLIAFDQHYRRVMVIKRMDRNAAIAQLSLS